MANIYSFVFNGVPGDYTNADLYLSVDGAAPTLVPSTINTYGTGGDYADPILACAAVGGIDDGKIRVCVQISDVTMDALFRPNQTWPNGGLIIGDTAVTGKTGDGRSLGNTNGTRVCLSPSANLDFQDIEFIKGTNTYSIQSVTGSDVTRVISKDLAIGPVNPYTSVFSNVVLGAYDLNTAGAATAQMNNVLAPERLIIRAGETLNFKNSASLATDWILGRGTYTGSETLVNYCYLLQSAPASDFGTGSSNNTYPSDITLEMVDYAGGDYRIKSTSALATAGEGGTFIGAFLEEGGGTVITPTGIASTSSTGTPTVINLHQVLGPTGIVSQESFGSVLVLPTQIIQPSSISSLEALGSPLILTGAITLAPTGIASQEASGTPSLIFAQLVSVTGIGGEEAFGIAIVQDGIELVIPVLNRRTYQSIQVFLKTTGKFVSKDNNGIILEWLRTEGVDSTQINDAFFKYWDNKGYTGAYNDKWKKWRG